MFLGGAAEGGLFALEQEKSKQPAAGNLSTIAGSSIL